MTSEARGPRPLLAAVAVSKNRRIGRTERTVLDSISLRVTERDRIAVVGPNGSGKTTLLRILCGVESPDSGELAPPKPFQAMRMAYVPQDYRNAFYPWLSMRQNLMLPFEAHGKERSGTDLYREFIRRASTYRMSIDLEKYPYQLSGGEQQIALLLRGLLCSPEVLMLDEPLSAVDQGRRQLIHVDLLQVLGASNLAVVLATHDIAEAILLADRVVVLDQASTRIRRVIDVSFGWPRSTEVKSSESFGELARQVSAELM